MKIKNARNLDNNCCVVSVYNDILLPVIC